MTLPMDSLESFEPRRDDMEGKSYDPYEGMSLGELRTKLSQIEIEVRRTKDIEDSRKRKSEENHLLHEMYILRDKIAGLEQGEQTLH